MKRIQRQRTKGWRMPERAIYVGRPTRWGNPYSVGMPDINDQPMDAARCVELDAAATRYFVEAGPRGDVESYLAPLRGRDLVCWCPLDEPCHADVLLELANR